MIKVIIKAETDSDFTLGFPKFIKGLYKIILDTNYYIELHLNEKTALEDLIDFLCQLDINSTKEWHKKDLNKGITDYVLQLKDKGLSSCNSDLLGGGNWSLSVEVYRIKEEFL